MSWRTLITEKPRFGVYVHWPFCLSKCPYCDFNSHVRHAAIDESRFVRAFGAEIAATAARVPSQERVDRFFGGGTPSLMQPQTMGQFSRPSRNTGQSHPMSRSRSKPIRAASRRRGLQAIARPASIAFRSGYSRSTTGRCAPWTAAFGARRAGCDCGGALGVRSVLVRSDFMRAGTDAGRLGGRARVRAGGSGRASFAFGFTIEQGTPFHLLHASGKLMTPDEDTARALYDVTQTVCAERRLSGLRGLQPLPARTRMPTQPGLLACTWICRHRTRSARPAGDRWLTLRDRDGEAARGMACTGRGARPRPDH